MTDGLDIVAVGIQHKRAIVAGVIVRAKAVLLRSAPMVTQSPQLPEKTISPKNRLQC